MYTIAGRWFFYKSWRKSLRLATARVLSKSITKLSLILVFIDFKRVAKVDHSHRRKKVMWELWPFYRGSNYPSQIMMSSCQIRGVRPNKVKILGKSQQFLEKKNAINRSDATQAQKNRTIGLHRRKWSVVVTVRLIFCFFKCGIKIPTNINVQFSDKVWSYFTFLAIPLVLINRFWCIFFQAEDGIRDVERSRGLGDVYKRQIFGDALKIYKYQKKA